MRFVRISIRVVLIGVSGMLLLAACFLLDRSFSRLPGSPAEEKQLLLSRLRGLEYQLKSCQAAERMQALFPEGGCFMVTLYGLAWSNVCETYDDPSLQLKYRSELEWVLQQYDRPHVAGPFQDTQVRRGVYWLGQRNLVLARYLQNLSKLERSTALVAEFHHNSQELHSAFLRSPTHHLDAYPGLCWPADNVTALASLVIHDQMYETNYRKAYNAWKSWTLKHAAQAGNLPAGQLDSQTGRLLGPSRGSSNSWNTALLVRCDTEFARQQYSQFRNQFGIDRLGFAMLREYPHGIPQHADVDSGPIIWDAGLVATGVGMAAARAQGDSLVASDIHSLAEMFGMPWNFELGGESGKVYLFGELPVADAFLAWGYSQPWPQAASARPSLMSLLKRRSGFYLLSIVCMALLAWLLARNIRALWRQCRGRESSTVSHSAQTESGSSAGPGTTR